MNVFKHVITLAVIGSAVFICSPAHALWGYPVNPPKAPSLTKTTYLTNPNVGQIQAAIKPNTRIVVIGTVNASGG